MQLADCCKGSIGVLWGDTRRIQGLSRGYIAKSKGQTFTFHVAPPPSHLASCRSVSPRSMVGPFRQARMIPTHEIWIVHQLELE